jgi:hypothetical protein
MEEHASRAAPLDELGYVDITRRALGQHAPDRDVENGAASRFLRNNRDALLFLGVTLDGSTLSTSGKVGVIPLKPAVYGDEPSDFVAQPMGHWALLSEFCGRSAQTNWLHVQPDWRVSGRRLDLELWYFARPFVAQSKSVLVRPGREFVSYRSIESFPQGVTDWTDYAVVRAPFRRLEFTNRVSVPTTQTLPHALMKWSINEITSSISNRAHVPNDYMRDILSVCGSLDGVIPQKPTAANLRSLPRTGAWTGYSRVYQELENIAALSGVMSRGQVRTCAFAIDAEELFELMTVNLASEWARRNGFEVRSDRDDSSRIGLVRKLGKQARMPASLRPDVVLLSDSTVIVIDAKYKRHYDLLSNRAGARDRQDYLEDFRSDIHQVLSYGVGFDRARSIYILTHPTTVAADRLSLGGLELSCVGGRTNVLAGLLPICLHKDMVSLDGVRRHYFAGLDQVLEALA